MRKRERMVEDSEDGEENEDKQEEEEGELLEGKGAIVTEEKA